ncbi:hypothetical protein [Hymenobacter cellulosivorans]|uniref:DUF4468 domain-containing protein n=1 Tax=Hymenobacter cellulosivorans TaxID=2932249 RepID=A0ABY4F2P4_9BACT|nr:hypothetical protein [Hymenobacter cellulosivorans]UOQ50934.1 hypothetical protein MUN80_14325 [Hymenobacter cellulosivorans]
MTHRFAYAAVVPVAGVSQADLVLRARAWAQRAASAGQVPVLATGPDTEVVRTTAARPFAYDWGGKALLCELRYTATISVRAGRYKYELKDFVLVEPGAGRYPDSTTPAETYYNGSFHPYNDRASRFQVTMRTCFTETVNEELARLQEDMRKPVRTARSE